MIADDSGERPLAPEEVIEFTDEELVLALGFLQESIRVIVAEQERRKEK
jgi:hypothetical protein